MKKLFFLLFFSPVNGQIFTEWRDWLVGQTAPVQAYNNGTVLCKAGDYTAGTSLLNTVTGELEENAQFNRGVAALEQHQWQQACDIYQKILEKNPENIKAQKNYEYARKKLEEEQQQQEQQKQDQESHDTQDTPGENKDSQKQSNDNGEGENHEKKNSPEKTKPEKPRSLSTQAAPLAKKLDDHEQKQQRAQLARVCSAAAGGGEMGW